MREIYCVKCGGSIVVLWVLSKVVDYFVVREGEIGEGANLRQSDFLGDSKSQVK